MVAWAEGNHGGSSFALQAGVQPVSQSPAPVASRAAAGDESSMRLIRTNSDYLLLMAHKHAVYAFLHCHQDDPRPRSEGLNCSP
jgi:hypothetical protein